MTVAKEVVQFLMGIFGDRQAAQGFLDDPEGVLEKHGLAGVSSADVDAAMPVVLDYAPLSVTASASDRDFNSGAGTGHAGGGGSPLPAGGITADVSLVPLANPGAPGARTVTIVLSDTRRYNAYKLNTATVP